MGQIAGANNITFNKDQLTPEGTWHVKLLHIAQVQGDHYLKGSIDNRSALNACPTMTLSRMGVKDSMISNEMMVGGFEGIACGEKDLKLLVGPCEFWSVLYRCKHLTVFHMLLRRLWIHSAGATHQAYIKKSSLFQELNSCSWWLKKTSQYWLTNGAFYELVASGFSPQISLLQVCFYQLYTEGKTFLKPSFQEQSWW